MQDFSFCASTRIVFGKDAERQAGKLIREFGGSRVLLHYGGAYAKKSGLLETVSAVLQEAGLYCIELGGVVPNPRLGLVYEGIELCRREKIDFILAVGGGSVIDSAKAIAMGLKYDGDVWELFAEKDGAAVAVETEACVPVGSVLTVAAAGSECSNSCVITKEDEKLKRFCDNDLHRPVFAIENPVLTTSLSRFQTACGIVDIFSHSMERYFSGDRTGNDLTDRLCEAVFLTCMECGRVLVGDPGNLDARADIMLTSSISHNGLTGMGRSGGGDWSSHFIEHELSAEFDIAHGAGLAAIIPAWMKYVYSCNMPAFLKWATRVMKVPMDFDKPERTVTEAIRRLEDFFHLLGLPTRLREMTALKTLSDADIQKMAERVRVTNKEATIGAVKPLTARDVVEIFNLAL